MRLLPRVLEFSSGTVITVQELTVADVRRLLDRGGNLGLGDILECCPGAVEIEGAPDVPEMATAWKMIQDLNPALFGGPPKKAGPLRTRKAARDLDLSCLAAVEAGHVQVWEYPYRLFVLLTERAKS